MSNGLPSDHSQKQLHVNCYRGFSIAENIVLSYDYESFCSLWNCEITNNLYSAARISKTQNSILKKSQYDYLAAQ